MALTTERPTEDDSQRALTVSQLTARIKGLLEDSFPSVWVEGEISNFSRPQSGHCYLTLKDERAQIRAVIWRGTAARLRMELHDGLEVVCRGSIDVYAPRGSYQLVVQQIEPRGLGALEKALRELHKRLSAEGLFDAEHKRPLPRFPRRIAVVTSPTGAAVRDFLEVLGRRWPGTEVLIVPVRVQGDGAAEEIAEAVSTVNRLPVAVDCLVVTRGGGSLEDLWAFNEEVVVRAIHKSVIPVVSAVGHELDVTLADLVADVRALTPSEAAERVVPAAEEIRAALHQYGRRLSGSLRGRAAAARSRLDAMATRRVFRKPYDRLHDLGRRLDDLADRSRRAVRTSLTTHHGKTNSLAARLEALSPLEVLKRGYTVTERAADGTLVRHADDLSVGEQLSTRFAQGRALSRVEQIDPPAGDDATA